MLAPDAEELLRGRPEFLGYIPQQFKVYGQKMAEAPSFYMRRIQKRLHSDVVSVLKALDPKLVPRTVAELKLGEVKEFGKMVELAQHQGVPLYRVTGVDPVQCQQAWRSFDTIAG